MSDGSDVVSLVSYLLFSSHLSSDVRFSEDSTVFCFKLWKSRSDAQALGYQA